MKNIFRYFAVLLLPVLLAGCQKEDTTPTYHKDIFRCKVNGVEWVATCPSDGLFGCEPIDCQYYWKDTRTISLGAVNVSNDKSVNKSIGLYKYKSMLGDNIMGLSMREYKDWNKPAGCRFHDLDTTAIRRLTILEVDTVKFLIKGTFEYTAINECQDTMHITDGYFHVNFRF
jgi:hypothetical protein